MVWILVMPPLILILGMLLSGRESERTRSREGVWRFSPERMEERAWAVQKEILPEATSPSIVMERNEALNPDGSWRGLWKAHVSDLRDGFLFMAVWEDATGELVQFSWRSAIGETASDGPGNAIRSEATAIKAAKAWMKRLSPRQWQAATQVKRGREDWIVYLVCPDGRMMVQMESATSKPTYLSFRPKRPGE
jgi:hypothetical protein